MRGAPRYVKAACGEGRHQSSEQPMSKDDSEKARRLAEALRQNLRRRKAQARGVSDPAERVGDGKDDSDSGGDR